MEGRVTRIAAEVINNDGVHAARVTRASIEVIASSASGVASFEGRVSRISVQVIASRYPISVEPRRMVQTFTDP
jgi:hypothetical protein